MFIINKVVIALFAISSCNILFGESSMKSELDDINKHLVATVQTTDLEENLKAIRELADKKAEGFHCNPFSKFCNKALKTLVSLSDIKCDGAYIDDLKKISDCVALDNVSHRRYEPVRRISKVVYELSKKQAKDCQNVYFEVFESKVANQDQNLVNIVKVFYDSLVDFESYYTRLPSCWIMPFRSVEDLFENIKTDKACNWWDRRVEIFKALTDLTAGGDDAKYLKKINDEITGTRQVDKVKLRAVYDKYLVSSCKYYVNHFGPEVFAPAMYAPAIHDAKMYHEVDKSKPEFYFGMAYYKLCTKFLPIEQEFFNNIVLEEANSRR